jgi:hypothetical protein
MQVRMKRSRKSSPLTFRQIIDSVDSRWDKLAGSVTTQNGEQFPHQLMIDVFSLRGDQLNYNRHPKEQIDALVADLRRFGQRKPIVIRNSDGAPTIVAGEGLTLAFRQLAKENLKQWGMIWATLVPDEWDDETARGYLVADNRTAQLANPDNDTLVGILERQLQGGYSLTTMGFTQVTYAELVASTVALDDVVFDKLDAKQPNPRNLPIDIIYTLQGADCTCCLAVQAGLKYGIQSAAYRLCPYTKELTGRHEVCFVDTDYFKYDHAVHLAVVQKFHPKYATVRDIMSVDQCKKDKIPYYDLAQILDWAHELSVYTDNVIVIPKYDCLDQIPAEYVLGYSIPTSHGGTPLPIEAFKGRRVHLLGGSWKDQLSAMAVLGDDVVSLDNNYVSNIAKSYGQATLKDGNTISLADMGLGTIVNPYYVAMAITFGSIAAKSHELFADKVAV